MGYPRGYYRFRAFWTRKRGFTGQLPHEKAIFEVADGGTIFLDEVGELPLQTQVRLLCVLESGEFMKVGSSKYRKLMCVLWRQPMLIC